MRRISTGLHPGGGLCASPAKWCPKQQLVGLASWRGVLHRPSHVMHGASHTCRSLGSPNCRQNPEQQQIHHSDHYEYVDIHEDAESRRPRALAPSSGRRRQCSHPSCLVSRETWWAPSQCDSRPVGERLKPYKWRLETHRGPTASRETSRDGDCRWQLGNVRYLSGTAKGRTSAHVPANDRICALPISDNEKTRLQCGSGSFRRSGSGGSPKG